MQTVSKLSLKKLSHNLKLIDGKISSKNTSIDDATALMEVKTQLISSDSDKVTRLMRVVGVTKVIENIGARLEKMKASLTLDRGMIAVVVQRGDREFRQYARPVMIDDVLNKSGLTPANKSYSIAKAYLEHQDIVTVLAAGSALESIERTIKEFSL
ncbi:hypothetical protein [Bdellovibrio sp. BCCA]|uniref:hypothetical protein n=1 Tax=Bdellovibrio sp. BCCA TaxID=3136281 RepID=UPI0030F051C1